MSQDILGDTAAAGQLAQEGIAARQFVQALVPVAHNLTSKVLVVAGAGASYTQDENIPNASSQYRACGPSTCSVRSMIRRRRRQCVRTPSSTDLISCRPTGSASPGGHGLPRLSPCPFTRTRISRSPRWISSKSTAALSPACSRRCSRVLPSGSRAGGRRRKTFHSRRMRPMAGTMTTLLSRAACVGRSTVGPLGRPR